MYFVYILKCSDNSYYTGVTNNIEKRICEHQEGIDTNCYTFFKRPVKLVLTESFGDSLEAIEREKQIKGWTRKKKEALINIDWQKLVKYSQKTSEKDFTLPCL
ncbi:MAG: hypothetical protein CVV50_03410 [Spirochaetae bacterium HGW-Spirochaetae-6]|nr:MAG: hypothetical protein CVV50_03410 [Spirochaetae bacterium HGW-Spirochaetae-6]